MDIFLVRTYHMLNIKSMRELGLVFGMRILYFEFCHLDQQSNKLTLLMT